jgi:hypothetical protein
VHHIGLCYEFSKAGDEFNAKNREHLLQSVLALSPVLLVLNVDSWLQSLWWIMI